ncbi:uncharacterized protein G2W53_037718 [Senna tora]|uniref:Uncharacterized protein n=1 Tax=Senna tora TaxID=362788 RepID=A0A834SKU2_9FABA|nr:uncharacterized protein G2W53_037718 [Senna tora]
MDGLLLRWRHSSENDVGSLFTGSRFTATIVFVGHTSPPGECRVLSAKFRVLCKASFHI